MQPIPLIAEIIGPSGAGKSTLSCTLDNCDLKIRAGITVWGLPLTLLFVSVFFSLPTLFALCAERKRIRTDEIKQVIRINAFYRQLKKYSEIYQTSKYTALFLDEGIVFMLAKLSAYNAHEKKINGKLMSRWEQNTLNRWSKVLDAVVWLDAPDELLIERIRTRVKQHRMKDKPDSEVHEFLARYRASYERIIHELKSRSNHIKVIKFHTDKDSLDGMTTEIMRLIKTSRQVILIITFVHSIF